MDNNVENILKASFMDKDNGDYKEISISFIYEIISLNEYDYNRGYTDCFTFPEYVIQNATVITAKLNVLGEKGKYCFAYERNRIDASNTYFLASLINLRLQLSSKIFEEFRDIEHLLLVDDMPIKDNLYDIMFKRPQPLPRRNEPIDISNKDLELIKNWCEKNGYPFSIRNKLNSSNITKTYINNRNVIHHIRSRLVRPNNCVAFWVWEFLRKLQILYAAFLLFYKIDDNYKLDDIGITDTLFSKYTGKECEQLLRKIYGTVKLTGILDFEQYRKRNKGMFMGYGTDDVFDLAIYSLFVYMEMFRQPLKRCSICSRLFKPKNGRQKYCFTRLCEVDRCNQDERPECMEYCRSRTCYPELAYKRKKLAEKKKNKTSD
ncbi:MAG: hypothetical protein IJH37_09200 [Clostridia bacterium]|nr:hypothetical protein [Clostridia bacterium]